MVVRRACSWPVSIVRTSILAECSPPPRARPGYTLCPRMRIHKHSRVSWNTEHEDATHRVLRRRHYCHRTAAPCCTLFAIDRHDRAATRYFLYMYGKSFMDAEELGAAFKKAVEETPKGRVGFSQWFYRTQMWMVNFIELYRILLMWMDTFLKIVTYLTTGEHIA